MVSALDSRSKSSGSSPGLSVKPGLNSLCYVLGQGASLSQCISPPRSINGCRGLTVKET